VEREKVTYVIVVSGPPRMTVTVARELGRARAMGHAMAVMVVNVLVVVSWV
jgi:hypothetical protein